MHKAIINTRGIYFIKNTTIKKVYQSKKNTIMETTLENTSTATESTAMADYIMQILSTQLTIVGSWGFNSPIALKDGVFFNVNGFKHSGHVRVTYNDCTDLFDIVLYDKHLKEVREIDEVYLDTLVDTLDQAIETGNDSRQEYDSNIIKWLAKILE